MREGTFWVFAAVALLLALAPAPLPPAEPASVKGKNKNGKPGKGNKPPGPDPLQRLEARDLGFHPDSRRQAFADLFWALLNSSEFTFNH